MFERIRFFSAGESHGPKISVILDGLPAGILLDLDAINFDLARRQKGFGRGGRMGIEHDKATITAGVMAGKTTGAPICLEIANKDYKSWKNKDIAPMTIPRPGHADLTGAVKFGHDDLRISLERASARETAMRVCVGALCKAFLKEFDIKVGGYVRSIGDLHPKIDKNPTKVDLQSRLESALENEFCLPGEEYVAAAKEHIHACMKDKDTLGGVFEVVALNLPIGLGSYTQWDKRLDTQIAAAMLSIQAMKGVEIGPAFENSGKRGTEVHDEIFLEGDQTLVRHTNRAGGLEGGITNGEPLMIRVAMKPISTTLNPLQSVDIAKGTSHPTEYERSDFCALPRAVPVGEAMLAYVLANALSEKLGGDSISEMLQSFGNLRKAHLDSFNLHNQKWQFGYEQLK